MSIVTHIITLYIQGEQKSIYHGRRFPHSGQLKTGKRPVDVFPDLHLSSLSESVAVIASDPCSCLTGVVFCRRRSADLRPETLFCVPRSYRVMDMWSFCIMLMNWFLKALIIYTLQTQDMSPLIISLT